MMLMMAIDEIAPNSRMLVSDDGEEKSSFRVE